MAHEESNSAAGYPYGSEEEEDEEYSILRVGGAEHPHGKSSLSSIVSSGSARPAQGDTKVPASSKSKTGSSGKKKRGGTMVRPIPSHLLLAPMSAVSDGGSISNPYNGCAGGVKGAPWPPVAPSTSVPSPSSSLSMATTDPRIQRDYIAMRKRAYDCATNENDDASSCSSSPTLSSAPASVWDGVSPEEKAMILCCERPNLMTEDDYNIDEEGGVLHSDHHAALSSSSLVYGNHHLYYPIGGVLAVNREVQFAALLASHKCCTMAAKSLAVAILERTLEQHLWEQREKERKAAVREDAKTKNACNDTSDSANNEKKMEVEEVDNDNERRKRSSRFTRLLPAGKKKAKTEQNTITAAREGDNPDDLQIRSSEDDTDKKRLERFFAAGGLKVLSQWLMEASGYDAISFKKSTPLPSTTTNTTTKRAAAHATKKSIKSTPEHKASSSRPIIMSILRFLEHIPFDKNCITDSKINKQIQKLGKLLSSILASQAQGEAVVEDLDNWTADPAIPDMVALKQTGEAVSAVKASWKEKAKHHNQTFSDPFQTLRDTIKLRLEEYTEFEAGSIDRPDWYSPTSVAGSGTKQQSTAAPTVDNAAKKKQKTLEMAAKERQLESEKFQKRIGEVRKKRQQQLQQIQEKLKKRMGVAPTKSTPSPGTPGSEGGRVSWKDGQKSGARRNRRALEEVFVFEKESPSALGTVEEREK